MARFPTTFFTLADAGLVLLFVLGLFLTHIAKSAAPAAAAPKDPVITDPRTCAALAVYQQATVDDWSQRATIAAAALNAQKTSGADPECGNGLASALSGSFKPILWQNALDAVDAVASGSYTLPDACARVTSVIPLRPQGSNATPQAPPARAQCVIYDLAFVGETP